MIGSQRKMVLFVAIIILVLFAQCARSLAIVSSFRLESTVMCLDSMDSLLQEGCLVIDSNVRSHYECSLRCARNESCLQCGVLNTDSECTRLPSCYLQICNPDIEQTCLHYNNNKSSSNNNNNTSNNNNDNNNNLANWIKFWRVLRCQNNGMLSTTPTDDHVCDCVGPFTGKYCENRVTNCQNNGIASTKAGRVCDCVDFYVGEYCERRAKSCQELKDEGYTTSDYVWIPSYFGESMLCKISSRVIWKVFASNGYYNRSLPWLKYRNGFYYDEENFWTGLEYLYKILKEESFEFRIKLVFHHEAIHYTQAYYGFRIHSPSLGYPYSYNTSETQVAENTPASVVPYNTMFDSKNVPFSTWDKDQDGDDSINCAKTASGGWWFKGCDVTVDSWANPNGISSYSPLTFDPEANMSFFGFDFMDPSYTKSKRNTLRGLLYFS